MNKHVLAAALACGLAASPALGPAALAQETDFYAGKQIRMIIGHPVGGDYDSGGRLLAKYLPKHIPGHPTIVVQNMPAAASVVAANYLYAQAPKDGTVFGSFSRNIPNQAVLRQANLEPDPRRFNWLGATSLPSRVCVAWHTSKVTRGEDLFEREMVTAGSGAGSSLSIVPTVLNHVLGTKFRVVQGYSGAPEAMLAIERGEVEGVCNSLAQFRSHADLIRDGKLRLLLHAEEAPIPEHPDLPSVFKFAKSEEQKQFLRFVFSSVEFGRPYVLPPEVPAERVRILRRAMAEALKDPELIAEAHKGNIDMTYRSPEELTALIENLHQTPQAMIEEVKRLVPNMQ
jgi:tripartite-type tricarboxylate transporter receptor subunit TctC